MRFILLLALLLYNIVTNSANYDYEDVDDKRLSSINSRRDWRKRVLNQPVPGWNNRMYDERHDPALSLAVIDRQKDTEPSPGRGRRYERNNAEAMAKNVEIHHNLDPKLEETRAHINIIDCARPHERYEACFAGCAAVSCDNPRDRLQPCYPFCEGGCICVHPYVRDDRTHKCVLPEDCTKGLKGIPDLVEEPP